MISVIGLEANEAKKKLEAKGFKVTSLEYFSRRCITGADSSRVIRERLIGNNSIEITVSRFKTKI